MPFPRDVLVNGRPATVLKERWDHRGHEVLVQFPDGLKTWWRAEVVRPNEQPLIDFSDRYKSTPPPPPESL